MIRSVQVRAPCRLHFGMFGFGHADRAQFGGVGMMIDSPSIDVAIVPATRFTIRAHLAPRVRRFVELAVEHWRLPNVPACEIAVRSPSEHTGLGVGTQLGLAVAAGLRRFLDLPDLAPGQLAASVNRGRRSAIGTYGFHHGGLIVDAGKRTGEPLGTLAYRLPLPESWRVVLVNPEGRQGLAGESEAGAFAKLPPVPDDVTQSLWQIAEQEMLPATKRSDCAAFGDAVYRFGRLAGECFAAVQGGPFASSQTTHIVRAIRDFGIAGVGQSSWGPTVFAVTSDDAESSRLSRWLQEKNVASSQGITIAAPNNQGAMITTSYVESTS